MKKQCLTLLLAGFVTASVRAGSKPYTPPQGQDRGGGDVVVLLDDTVVLADPFGVTPSEDPDLPFNADMLFSDDLKIEIKRINFLIEALTSVLGRNFSFDKLTAQLIMNPDIQYYLVAQVPPYPECQQPAEYPWLPAGATVRRVACTIGKKTWIVKDLFERMNVREQGLLSLHEGLRRLDPAVADDTIYRISKGFAVGLMHLNSQLSGVRLALTDVERATYFTAYRELLSVRQMSDDKETSRLETDLKDLSQHTIYKNGGALIHLKADVDASAFLGVGATIGSWGSVGANAEVVNSFLCQGANDCDLANNVTIRDSNILYTHSVTIAEGSEILSTYLSTRRLTVGAKSRIVSSNLTAKDAGIYLKARVLIEDVRARFQEPHWVWWVELVMEEGSEWKHLKNGLFQTKDAEFPVEFRTLAGVKVDFRNSECVRRSQLTPYKETWFRRKFSARFSGGVHKIGSLKDLDKICGYK